MPAIIGGHAARTAAAKRVAMRRIAPAAGFAGRGVRTAAAVTSSSSGFAGGAKSVINGLLPTGSARRRIMLGNPGTRGRRARAGFGIGVGGAMGLNAVLGPRPPSSGAGGLRPGGSQLPY